MEKKTWKKIGLVIALLIVVDIFLTFGIIATLLSEGKINSFGDLIFKIKVIQAGLFCAIFFIAGLAVFTVLVIRLTRAIYSN